MAKSSAQGRTDTASRIIDASPTTLFDAFSSAEAWKTWLPPRGMKCRVEEFDFSIGGNYRLELIYETPDHAARGKTSEHSDVIRGRFVEFVPAKRVVQIVEFDSDDSAFEGAMMMTWKLSPVASGTKVTIICDNVPAGIRSEDHAEGLRSTLANLAAFSEQRASA